MSSRTSPRELTPQKDAENLTDSESEDGEQINRLRKWGSPRDGSQDLEIDIMGDNSPKPVRRSAEATPPNSSPRGRRRSPRLNNSDYQSPEYRPHARKPIHRQGKTLQSETGIESESKHEVSYPRLPVKDSPRASPKGRPAAQDSPRASPKARSTRHKQTTTDESSPWESPLCVICGCILGVLLFYFLFTGYMGVQRHKSQAYSNDTLSQFNDKFKELKANFPSQGRRFWSTISAATKRIIAHDNVIQPAVILLAGKGDSASSIACLTRQYAEIVTSVLQSDPAIEINVDKLKEQDSNEMKLTLDEKLQDGFSRGSKVAVLHQLDAVHPNAAMLLHAYCDNENAPFKETVILLTMQVRESAKADHDIEEYLRHKWEADITEDNFAALMSRISNNVVILQPESKEHLDKKCKV